MKNIFTGERILSDDPRLKRTYYQSLVAYLFATKFTKNKRVLDLACGDAYGSEILSRNAKEVTAIDYDEITINNARTKYKSVKNLKFRRVDFVKDIPKFSKFDVIVSFQAIEHFENVDEYTSKVKKLLKTGGIFIVSTPNKSQVSYGFNPFHYHDFDLKMFSDLLKKYFKGVLLYGVNGNKNATKAKGTNEKLARSIMRFFPSGIVKLIPLNVSRTFYAIGSGILKSITYTVEKKTIDSINEDSFFVSRKDVKKALDLLAVCKK